MVAKNAARAVPDEWRRSVKRHLDAWIEEHAKGKTTREVAELMHMKQPTLVQLLNMKGSFGIHVLIQVRKGIKKPLDELLDLADLETLDDRIKRHLRDAAAPPAHRPVPVPAPLAKRNRAE